VLDDYKNDKGSLEFLWNHGVMSDEIWANITAHCSFGPSDGVSCEEAKSAFDFRPNFVKNAGNINPYNIYINFFNPQYYIVIYYKRINKFLNNPKGNIYIRCA
jgi:hypothetical protein